MSQRMENRAIAPSAPTLHAAPSTSASSGTLAVPPELVPGWQAWAGGGLSSTAAQPAVEAAHPANPIWSTPFIIALALLTLLPLLGIPMMTFLGGGLMPGTFTLLAITGPMHVASTSFFYFDRDFWPVLRDSPVKCIWSLAWLPLLLLGFGIAGTAMIGAWAAMLLFSFHNTWLFYHYQRQNFGLVSFLSTHVGGGRLPARVNTVLNLSALGAIISMLGTPNFIPNGARVLTPDVYFVLRATGTVTYALSVCMMIWVFRCEPRLRQNALVAGGLVLALAFFLPAVVFDASLGFLPYAIAHGAQYILMMSVLSGRSRRGWVAFLTMCALGVTIGLIMNSMRSGAAFAVGLALVQVHFLVDAKVWRLREPLQRVIINRRFDFLLAPRASA